ncbi:MAG: N-6 DNA methylase [Actinomycetaceae bacterium]|nr:N-6 DNA methylase [Actinomycetaceae bacterium]
MTTALHDAASRKARGAFFTPAPIAEFIAAWAVRAADDVVLDPSCGDAAFLIPGAARLREHGSTTPVVEGVEIDGPSASLAQERVERAGATAVIRVGDFFGVAAERRYDAIIGNPPYIRYQGFKGQARAAARQAALRGGVALTALASSWAPFVVHAAQFLRPGGRLGFVLPAELLSVNYAGPVRRFLFQNFGRIELILFERQIFPDAEADTLILLAEDFGGEASSATIRQVASAAELAALEPRARQPGAVADGRYAPPVRLDWRPADPAEKWTDALVEPVASTALSSLARSGRFARLDSWGPPKLGAVTGNNRYFTMSPSRARELGLGERDLVRISPAGSAHLRGLELSRTDLTALGRDGGNTWLFRPAEPLSQAAAKYVAAGRKTGVDEAYKCRVRTPWYRVPLLEVPDLFLTCMNADTPRLTTNGAGVYHLNSVHGVYLREGERALGRELLPLASLNSATMLSAEVTGRSYGGGILKLEPGEAARWLVPSSGFVAARAGALRAVREDVAGALHAGELEAAVALVDEALLVDSGAMDAEGFSSLRQAWEKLAERRARRGRKSG